MRDNGIRKIKWQIESRAREEMWVEVIKSEEILKYQMKSYHYCTFLKSIHMGHI